MVIILSEREPEDVRLIRDDGKIATLDIETGRIYDGPLEVSESWWTKEAK